MLLHATCPPPESSEQAKIVEKQAHRFAAAFLLPGDAFLEDLDGAPVAAVVTLSTLVAFKERWGVAIKAMVVRLQQLGQVDADQARSLYKQISARGWNTGEPVFVGNERAVWLSKALTRRFPGGAECIDAARESGLHASWFDRWTNWEAADDGEATVLPFSPRGDRPRRFNAGSASVTPLGR